MLLRGTIFSEVLESDTGISFFLPDKQNHAEPMKVAYLLHGIRNTSGSFADKTMLPVYANEHNTLIVMPDGARSFYTDMKHGAKYYSYITKELPKVVSRFFKVSDKREDCAVIGTSMGGYGAFRCAFLNPEQYGYCAAISSGGLLLKKMFENLAQTELFMQRAFGSQLLSDFRSVFGEEMKWEPQYDLMELLKKYPKDLNLNVYMACGTEDAFWGDNRRFSNELKNRQFPVTYEEWQGKHDWYFFDTALRKALDFVDGINH